MDYLWSPWRYSYVSRQLPAGGCIFCDKPKANDDKANLIVHRGKHNFVLLNLYPYTSGHLMVAPYDHVATLSEASEEAALELMSLTRATEAIIDRVYKPQGLNIGMNIGQCAGAGVAGHIHMHVLPRWVGDANFMTVVGETRIAVEELEVTWQRLTPEFAALSR